ncbi:MAG: L-threonine 3-dehydrogenase [Candidatus Zixiibacteriota bacterium]
MNTILVTGALGQIGSELTSALRKKYGESSVIATDIRMPSDLKLRDLGTFEVLDVTDEHHITRVMQQNKVDTIYHLAAILSAVGESRPGIAWQVNMGGLYNMLEAARQYHCKMFFPSSIGAFGPSTPKKNTPQMSVMRPETMYGVTKLSGELLCDYYFRRFGVDTRSLRFPGLISYETEPGGGTTDYAVEMFFDAIKHKKYTCYLRGDSSLDMMYMSDAIKSLIELMEADGVKLINRNAYNITAMSLTPDILANEIRKNIPEFEIKYEIDPVRQKIADSWPDSIDDSVARKEWGWKNDYDLPMMVEDMLDKIKKKI